MPADSPKRWPRQTSPVPGGTSLYHRAAARPHNPPRSSAPDNATRRDHLLPTAPTFDSETHADRNAPRPGTKDLGLDLAPTPGVFFMLRLPLRVGFGHHRTAQPITRIHQAE